MYITLVTAYLIMYLAHHKLLNKKQFCEMNEVNEQKLFFVMIYDVLNTLFKWAVTNVIYTTDTERERERQKERERERERGERKILLLQTQKIHGILSCRASLRRTE